MKTKFLVLMLLVAGDLALADVSPNPAPTTIPPPRPDGLATSAVDTILVKIHLATNGGATVFSVDGTDYPSLDSVAHLLDSVQLEAVGSVNHSEVQAQITADKTVPHAELQRLVNAAKQAGLQSVEVVDQAVPSANPIALEPTALTAAFLNTQAEIAKLKGESARYPPNHPKGIELNQEIQQQQALLDMLQAELREQRLNSIDWKSFFLGIISTLLALAGIFSFSYLKKRFARCRHERELRRIASLDG